MTPSFARPQPGASSWGKLARALGIPADAQALAA